MEFGQDNFRIATRFCPITVYLVLALPGIFLILLMIKLCPE